MSERQIIVTAYKPPAIIVVKLNDNNIIFIKRNLKKYTN